MITFQQLQERLCWMELKPEEWHQHPNGGGWVQNTATVEVTVYVSGNAQVYGNARVYGDAQVYGDAWVYANPQSKRDAKGRFLKRQEVA